MSSVCPRFATLRQGKVSGPAEVYGYDFTCWGPSPLTMVGGGGEASIGRSGLRSWLDSRGEVWSAMSPSFTPMKRDPPATKTLRSMKMHKVNHQDSRWCRLQVFQSSDL